MYCTTIRRAYVFSLSCMTTQTTDTCSLHGEIPGRMMLFHVRHAVILFLETFLSLTGTEVRLCKGV